MVEMKDYYKGLFCNANDSLAFAIEAEVSSKFREKKLIGYDYKSESSNIKELLGIHNLNQEGREKVHDLCKEEYKDRFPIGRDGLLSGGTHFVLFGDFRDLNSKNNIIKNKILNCPLHLKIMDGSFYGRDLHYRSNFVGNTNIGYGSKSNFLTLKDELFSHHEDVDGVPIEFRCNNVFDERILGYYQGIILATEKRKKFKILSNDFRLYSRNGDMTIYNNREELKTFDKMKGFTPEESDLEKLKYNINIIFSLLEERGFINSLANLKKYLIEKGITF